MSAPKQEVVFGLLGKSPETSYGAGGAALVAGTDGILCAEDPILSYDWVDSGDRGLAAGAAGVLPQAPPSGSGATFTTKHEVRGAGAAYSAGVRPPDIHMMMLMALHSATGSFGAGTEKYTYAPVSVPFASIQSGYFDLFGRGQKYSVVGAYADFNFAIEGPETCDFEFPVSSILSAAPTDVALPAITYATVMPPKFINATFSLGTGTPFTSFKVKRVSFKRNQVLDKRVDVQSGGHAGFTPGRRRPELEIEMEAVALATTGPFYTATTLNPYKLWELGTAVNVTFQVGATQYNRMKFAAPQAIITKVAEGNEGATATWVLTFVCTQSTPIANDDYNIVFD